MQVIPILEASGDIQARVRALRNQPDVRKFMYTDHEISEAEYGAWLDSLKGSSRQSVFVVMHDAKACGVVSLNAINALHRTADWAFYLDSELQGQGLGSRLEYWLLDYAFNVAGLEKLNCEVLQSNPAVIRMHRKFGFSIEGVRRQNVVKDGVRIDVVLLGITRQEWFAHRLKMQGVMARLNRVS
ncbi:pseudaminic acid biosynthesis N-acetyl transferase [Pseudomonas sp. GM74]|uniref:UDP-4-amino-4, 6-dideoxy-N-acetyl-beta-L-altrosamine N-acetyltransferase n=1 Tax=Pseudomonas sp. GM74 TaxID=1144336 RepID=UPI000270B2D1|nr:UDP-4-amino-4,6-dideoxy-N-acetyl-beta-L-altrosamine N-acetyltransferase [Pseudomonas sp. GM74]EJM96958.1 pseudaminic acid biosynthesis N-acetyl transferase [Pseudomonas sp. GM74]